MISNKKNTGSVVRIVTLFVVIALSIIIMPMTFICSAVTTDNTISGTHVDSDNVIMPPTVVVDVSSSEVLSTATSAEKKPSNVILTVDSDLNVVDGDGAVIDSFDNVYTALNHEIIPIVYVSSESVADSIATYLTKTKKILDIAIMSNDPELISKVKDKYSVARGIVEFSGSDLDDKYDMVKTANLNGASVVVVPASYATVENVSYLQSMFKTVWVRTNESNSIQVSDNVFSGAYGLIVSDAKPVYDFYGTLNEKTYTRTPFVVGHRGDPQNCHENSISGIYSAAANGATHVELDFHFTSDNKIICMHNDTLNSTTTYGGSKKINEMTLAQVRQYKLHKSGLEDEDIPTFEECIEAILETNMHLILELKCTSTKLIGLIKEVLDGNDEYAELYSRLVVITFNTPQLTEMLEVMPEVPTANLNDANKSNFKTVLEWMGKWNTVLDPSKSNVTDEFHKTLVDHGIIPWTWTHSTYAEAKTAQQAGYIGLTTNQASEWRNDVKSVKIDSGKLSKKNRVGNSIDVKVVSYKGDEQTVKGVVTQVKGNRVVASVTIDGYTYYTQSVTISYRNNTVVMIVSSVAGVVVMVGIFAFVYIRKKKTSQKTTDEQK